MLRRFLLVGLFVVWPYSQGHILQLATASLVAMVVVTLMTEAPDAETQAMVDEVRIPSGQTILGSTH